MKFVIVGGVAAGTKTAAKLKREHQQDEVVIYTKGNDISYAGCGLPYFVSGVIESKDELIVNTPQKFAALTGVEVHTGCEVTQVNAAAKTIIVKTQSATEQVSYDALVLATGAEPAMPPVEGIDLEGVFGVRTPDDAIAIRNYTERAECKRAVVVGGGLIGLEMAENLMKKGLTVTVMDMAPQLMPEIFDSDMADYVRRQLVKKGLRIMTGTAVRGISGTDKVQGVRSDAGTIGADIVIVAAGIRPATKFLEGFGLVMERGLIVTDEYQKTNLDGIYAVGDCAQVHNRITGAPQWSAMGSTANITGRTLALNLCGEEQAYPGCLGTGVVRLADDLNAARTGLTEAQAKAAGYQMISAVSMLNDKAHYYAGYSNFVIKLIADRISHKLLGLQVIGSGSVDKLADIAVTAISLNASVDDLLNMDFAYAPPFSTAIHPVAVTAGILLNKMKGKLDSFTPIEYANGAAAGYRVIDLYPQPTIPGAEWLDLTKVQESAQHWNKEEKLLLVCTRGRRAYLAQNKLMAMGFEHTKVLEGGGTFNVLRRSAPGGKLSALEIKRVKGLGCLQDKRFGDVFNVRVITRNGKITAEQSHSITEAAETFGSGEITMTTRLTLEIQGVPYANIDPLIEFLAARGLETGGTGSLVRPVVSCKGTTCQYGLIDTYSLSEKLHERFYKGYHTVTLPHKFKIAVGGCPNNCVKPDLNDLGIIGQRMPMFDFSKCRGCKVCQVEKACPIHTAKLEDGMLKINADECNHCGRCVEKCPFGVTTEYQNGYKIYIGGRWGKRMANGRPLEKFFTSEEEVLDIVERAILLFRNEGQTGERFADTVARLGFDYVQDKLLHAEIDKTEILNKQVKGGATC